VPLTVLMLYMGTGGIVIAAVSQFLDKNNRFFSPEISDIPLKEIGVIFASGCIGIFIILLTNTLKLINFLKKLFVVIISL
jgi:hypothetical protein